MVSRFQLDQVGACGGDLDLPHECGGGRSWGDMAGTASVAV